MSLFAVRPKNRLSAATRKRAPRTSLPGIVRGAAGLACLLALFVCYRVVSSAVAVEPAPPAAAGNTASAVLVLNGNRQSVEPNGGANELTTEPEDPAEYEAVVAKSPYPRTGPPHELTAEQLDAIAKLAPKTNKDGFRVHPAMLPLFRSMVLHYTGGTYKNAPVRFRLHVPEPLQEGKKYPLVVWLHGSGECGSDNINQLSHLHHILPYLVGPKKRDFFLLVPQCPHTHGAWEAPEICSTTIRADGTAECHLVDDPVELADAPVAFTLAMVDAVKRQFPVDADQITVAGLSTGGDGTWQIVQRRPGLFAAAAPIVSWRSFPEKALREKPLLKKVPIWAIYSSDDQAIDFARKEFERVREAGCNVHKTEFGVCGHRAWTPAMLQGDVFGWLISRAKEGDRYFAARPSGTSPEKIGIFADVTEGDLAKRTPTKAPLQTRPATGHLRSGSAVPSDAVEFDDDDVKSQPAAKGPTLAAPEARPVAASGSMRGMLNKNLGGPSVNTYTGTVVVETRDAARPNSGPLYSYVINPSGVPVWTPPAVVPATAATQPDGGVVNGRVYTAPPAVGTSRLLQDGEAANWFRQHPAEATAIAPPPAVNAAYAIAPYVVTGPNVRYVPGATNLDIDRMLLVTRYIHAGQARKAIDVANKVKNRRGLVEFLLGLPNAPQEILDYVDRELDRMEQRGDVQGPAPTAPEIGGYFPPRAYAPAPAITPPPTAYQPGRPATPLQPIPEGKKSPMDDCGKEWEMATENLYGLFPNGWDKESSYVPDYVINETGKQLRDRLFKAFAENDLPAVKEFCQSFIRLDDIPLSSPWFDTSGGRLQGRINYSLNEKAKPVVELLRDIATVRADSKKEFVELARKSLDRIDAITHPKSDK